MAQTKFAVIIGSISRLQIYRSVRTDDSMYADVQARMQQAMPGCEMHLLPIAELANAAAALAANPPNGAIAYLDNLIAQQSGVPGPTVSHTCCVVDATNTVVCLWRCDPKVFTCPGFIIIQADGVPQGSTWNGTAFTVPVDPKAAGGTLPTIVPASIVPAQPTVATKTGLPGAAAL